MRPLPLADPGTPDLRSAGAFLWWLARRQRRTLLVGMSLGMAWMVAQALLPWALGRALDEGISDGDRGALLRWALVLAALAVAQAVAGVVRHRFAVTNWLVAAFTSAQLVGHHVTRVGAALPTRLPTGEVVSTVASDAIRLGEVYDTSQRFAGAIAGYAVVAVLLLHTSTTLGLVVLIGIPLLGLVLGLIVRPLQHRQAAHRKASGELTTLGADAVAGLRVLRGVGGEGVFLQRYRRGSQEVRRAGVQVAGVQATLDGLQVLLPGAFTALVTWLGARLAVQGSITTGELVAFYGYSLYLVTPLRTATEMLAKLVRAHVGATRVVAVLSTRPATVAPERPLPEPAPGAALHDPESGLTLTPGALVGLVSPTPAAASAIADRLGRFDDAAEGQPARLGDVPLTLLPLDVVRRRVVVSDAEPQLFSGSLRGALDPGSDDGRPALSDRALLEALRVAAADDVLDALPEGLDSEVTERGRAFSGGQRQRLALARALLREAETLVLVEPTSAVDAHTEAAIAGRLAAARKGQATLVVSTSPLLLGQVDEVAFVDGGRVVARGTHHELLRRGDEVGLAYAATVTRGEAE